MTIAFAAALLGLRRQRRRAAQQAVAPAEVVKELAPTGSCAPQSMSATCFMRRRIRRAGELRGITPDLARALAQRLGVPIELISIRRLPARFSRRSSLAISDLAFMAIEPARATEVSFSPAYMIIEGTYVVQATPRCAPRRMSTAKAFASPSARARLTISISRARSSACSSFARRPRRIALDQFLSDKLDAAAGVRQRLAAFAAKTSGAAGDGRSVSGDSTGHGHAAVAATPRRAICATSSRR